MSSNQHIQQDRQIDPSQISSQYQRNPQIPTHSQVPQVNVGNLHDEYSFDVEINQNESGQYRQFPQSKMKQTSKYNIINNYNKSSSSYITPQKQKDNVQNIIKDMRKYLQFINNTDWMFTNDQNPVDNYLKN